MMPPGSLWHIVWRLIRPNTWKGCSANFGLSTSARRAALLLGKLAKKRSPAALEGGFHEGLATAVGHRAYLEHVIGYLPQMQLSPPRRTLTTQGNYATMSERGPTGVLGGGTVGPGLVVEGSGKGLKAWPGEP